MAAVIPLMRAARSAGMPVPVALALPPGYALRRAALVRCARYRWFPGDASARDRDVQRLPQVGDEIFDVLEAD